MVAVNVSAPVSASTEKTWAAISDLSRFEEWLTIHQDWKGELPDHIAVGTTVTEVVSVMGMSNKIEWVVDEYDPPRALKISGTGTAGVKITFTLAVEPDGEGSTATIDAELTGQMIVGPIGSAVGKNTKAELEKSIAALSDLVG